METEVAKRPRKHRAKVGTGPGTIVVLRGAPLPRLKLSVKFKEVAPSTPERNLKWETGIIDRIDECGRIHIERF